MSKHEHGPDGKWYPRTAYSVAEDWPGAVHHEEYIQPWTVTYGHDGGIDWPVSGEPHPDDLTADDMRELADIMIDRWTRFRASLVPDKKINNTNLPGKYEDQDSEP